MACLTIGYRNYLMPSEKAMKVAEMMQHAIECNVSYTSGNCYTPTEQPSMEFALVRHNQIRMPPGAPASTSPRLLK